MTKGRRFVRINLYRKNFRTAIALKKRVADDPEAIADNQKNC
ncbi:hypothetical protein [Oscillatoria sp. HE19RPO]|nr:hypothetical protein [Oscillatoria sp. HE19RPO]